MTTTVDWTAVERRARRLDVLVTVPLVGWFASLVALTGGFVLWSGAGAWWAVAAYSASFVALLGLQRTVPRLRRTAELGHRVQFALRHHLDPGAGAREKADVLARRQAQLGWVPWSTPLPVAAFLLNGRWDRPATAVPAAVVLVGLSVAGAVLLHRQVRAARRWVAEPPGPPREVPPPTALERWTGGRRMLLVALALVVLGLLAGLLAALLS